MLLFYLNSFLFCFSSERWTSQENWKLQEENWRIMWLYAHFWVVKWFLIFLISSDIITLRDSSSIVFIDVSSYQFCKQYLEEVMSNVRDIIVMAGSILIISMIQSLITFWHKPRILAGEYLWTFYCNIFWASKCLMQIIFCH